LSNGKPRLNGSPSCACQFTDWSHDTNGGHVPGYTIQNSPLAGMPYVAGPNGHPQWRGNVSVVQSQTSFSQWFADSPGSNPPMTHTVGILELGAVASDRYRFATNPDSVQGGFFPLDPAPLPIGPGNTPAGEPLLCNLWPYWYSSAQFGAGNGCKGDQYLFPPSIPTSVLVAMGCATKSPPGCVDGAWAAATQGRFHDFWFTGESHSYFQLPATGVSLQAYGADDIFVFINGKLLLDLGGTHEPIGGKVVIDTTGNAYTIEGGFLDANGEVLPCPSGDPRDPMNTKACPRPVPGDDCRTRLVPLGLKPGSVYELAIFIAQRTPSILGSAFSLDMSAPTVLRSVCSR